MEHAVFDRMGQEALRDVVRQFLAVDAGTVQRFWIGERNSVDPVDGKNPATGAVPIDGGNDEMAGFLADFVHFVCAACFEAQVGFPHHGIRNGFSESHRFQTLALG